jgi:hypothetical protein
MPSTERFQKIIISASSYKMKFAAFRAFYYRSNLLTEFLVLMKNTLACTSDLFLFKPRARLKGLDIRSECLSNLNFIIFMVIYHMRVCVRFDPRRNLISHPYCRKRWHSFWLHYYMYHLGQ